jgi:hypothetical protein
MSQRFPYIITIVALKAIYPEHPWDTGEWASGVASKGEQTDQWDNIENQRKFFDKTAVAFNIQKPTDWYNVTAESLRQCGGGFIDTFYRGSVLRGKTYTRWL